jgi:hypothetical protein
MQSQQVSCLLHLNMVLFLLETFERDLKIGSPFKSACQLQNKHTSCIKRNIKAGQVNESTPKNTHHIERISLFYHEIL